VKLNWALDLAIARPAVWSLQEDTAMTGVVGCTDGIFQIVEDCIPKTRRRNLLQTNMMPAIVFDA
jgi:hypothetical protein